MGPMKNTASVQDLIDVYTRIQDMYRAASNVELRLGVVHHVMIVCKPSDPFLVPLTRELTIWLLETYPHLTVFVNDTLKDEARFTAKTIQARCGNRLRYWDVDIAEREHIDLVVTLGGDGTVLYAANLFQRQVPVIVPFHLGSLGFLTVFNFDQYHLYLSTILENGGLLVNMRMRICCKVYKRPRTNGTLEPPHNVDGHLHQPTPSFAANHVSEPNGFYRGVRTPVNVFEATPSLREQRRARNQAAQNPFGSEHSRKSSLNDIGLGEMIHHIQALNELVIDRGANATMIQLDLYTDERPFTTILADGLVIGKRMH
jgi:NAD kinase